MRKIIGLAAILLAAGCAPAQTAASAAGCQAVATESWTPAGSQALTITANASGPDCEHAVATITVRDASNEVMFTNAYVSAQVMVLADARDVEAMQAALAAWINSDNHTFATTAALPDWPQGAEGPGSGEFPLHVDESLDRANYLALRSRSAPTLCYVQGMESLNCLALENDLLTPIGVQQFPG